MPLPRFSYKQHGFTLVELSIVLVIIGLVLGSIVVGRDMINAARTRMAIAQIEKYKTAVNTFRSKYNALPGDMTEDQADDVGFTVPASRTDTANMTHGNGLIEDNAAGDTYLSAALYGENLEFWEDLSSAGLIDEHFATAQEVFVTAANLTRASLGKYLPPSVMGNNNWIAVVGVLGAPNNTWMLPDVPRGNYFLIVGIVSTSAASIPTNENDLTPLQAQSIDTKIDDGVFDGGTVRASNRTPQLWINGLSQSATGTCATLKAWGAPVDGYRTDMYADTPACQLSFRF
jgi:prepilin-type N-terminal cleavage/methylation domain-containing protein